MTNEEKQEVEKSLLEFVTRVTRFTPDANTKYPEEVKVLPDIVEILLTRF
jgi:hypothetical protein